MKGDYQDSLVAGSALASDDIWAVGTGFVTSPTGQTVALLEHWDGRVWTVVKGADTAGRSVRLNAVAAVAPNDVWAVGEYYPSNDESTPFQPLIEHWNGSSWNIVPSPAIGVGEDPFSGRSLEAITVVSADDVWILGHYDINNNVPATQVRDLFEHWDGHAWTVVKSPQDTTGTGISAMQSLSADATNDAWAVGGRVNGFGEVSRVDGAIVERWNGRAWGRVTEPASEGPLTRVAAIAPSDVWAVRGGDLSLGLGMGLGSGPIQILRWDGRSWTISLRLSQSNSVITSITAPAHNDVWAVGTKGGLPLIEHWDGRRWAVPGNADEHFPPLSEYAAPPSVSRTLQGDVVVFSAEPDPSGPQNRLWFRCGGTSS